jgi:hypothetical protein
VNFGVSTLQRILRRPARSSLIGAFLLFPSSLFAQPAPVGMDTAGSPGAALTIYVMTMGPGREVWERFGHIAIGVRDAATGTDSVYNYGLFSFSQPGFIRRFIQGRMMYWMGGEDAQWTLTLYRRLQRSVWVQELNLTPAQRLQLRDFLRWNEQPENKYYRYDYYRDNCSTRVRDAIDRVLGGVIRRQTDTVATGTTFRFHTQRLVAGDLPIYVGMLVAMGHPIDHPISAWEEMFLPFAVRTHLRSVTVRSPDGSEIPLVRSEQTLYESNAFQTRDAPPNWLPGFILAGLLLAASALGLASLGKRRQWARTGFVTLATFWYLLMGMGGLILLGLWAFTDHVVTYQNENVLQLNLMALPLAVLLPVGVRKSGNSGLAALRISLVVAALSLAGLLVKVVPGFQQVNLQIVGLVLPVDLGLAAGLLLLRGAER